MTDSSWVMRDLWNAEKHARGMVPAPKKLKSSGVMRLIERALKAQGIRKSLRDGQGRHEFQTDHGFRKFFKSSAEQAMRPINVEILMGHSTGISDSCYRLNERELLEDYFKAVPELTILPENQQYVQIQKQETRISELEKSKVKIDDLRSGVKHSGRIVCGADGQGGYQEATWSSYTPSYEQIESLKHFSSSPPLAEAWEAFTKWSKKGLDGYENKKNET